MAWNPFGVALEITATGSNIVRTSAKEFTVDIKASWETYYSGANTIYGMKASSGGITKIISSFDGKTSRDKGSASFTGTYSISGNGSATKAITVTFENFNTDNEDSAKKSVTFNVTVPAWTSYTVSYNANGGTGAPSKQTKWKDQNLTLSSTKPTRTGYTFLGWATSASGAAVYSEKLGMTYKGDAAVTLYAVWQAMTYTVSYDANGGTGAPSSQTKTYGTPLAISSTKPTKANYAFKGWGLTASATTVAYASGASYTANAAVTLYAIWELSYVKPRIFNLSVERCLLDGTPSEDSTTAVKVHFDWETDKDITACAIRYKLSTAAVWNTATIFGQSGKSGTVDKIITTAIDPEKTYTFEVDVTDGGGSNTATIDLSSMTFPIDAKAGGKGVAFGKAAELDNTAEFEFDAKFNSPVYGRALGMDKLPAIPSNSDFNNYLTTGCYAVHSNAIAESCTNIPVDRAGRLEVWSSTGEGVRAEQWSYLRQRFIPYNDSNAVWERDISRSEDNVWRYYDWYRSSLTPEVSEKVYSKSAITIGLNANTVLGAVNTYTKIPFDKNVLSTNSRLTLSSNAVHIGSNIQYVKASAQVLVSPASSDGLRHVRIQKVSGGTTTSVAWGTLYFTGSRHLLHALTPIVVSVKEGDLLQMVFYTGNASDSISSGTAANGYQTYLTVEEL